MEANSHGKRIARNTVFLYFRMIITMAVQLYTVRIVLKTLGVSDYGIYNVVGGVVTMFAFLTTTMANASERFFAYEIGRNDRAQLTKTFSMTLLIYCLMGITIVVLGETVGLWFLNHKLTIPVGRLSAANWVFQFSLLTFMLTMFQVPYDAMVIANEKMNVFAYVSIIEVTLKLLVVYFLVLLPFDKLKTYAVLIFIITFLITTIYKLYCLRKFQESRFKYYWDTKLFKEILSYSGWNLFGTSASVLNNQGINIVLNIFFGPVVNAARALAYQINAAINTFVSNFMTATRPQIVKNYAGGEMDRMLQLVYQSAKFAFFLLFIISLPVLLETDFILKLWLKDIPQYVVLFVRIIIATALIDAMSLPIMAAVQATGNIKRYQAIVGGCFLLNVPISYIFFKLGFPPQTALIIAFANAGICLFLRLLLLKRLINSLSIKRFIEVVILKVVIVSTIASAAFLSWINYFQDSLARFLIIVISSVIASVILIYFIGCDSSERDLIREQVNKIKNKFKNGSDTMNIVE